MASSKGEWHLFTQNGIFLESLTEEMASLQEKSKQNGKFKKEWQVSKKNGIFSESHRKEWQVPTKCLQRMGSGRKEWFEVII